MIVCLCRRVSDRDIAFAVSDGCDSFDDLQTDLGVGTACGCCEDCAKQTFDQQRRAHAGVCASAQASQDAGRQPLPASRPAFVAPSRRRLIPIVAQAVTGFEAPAAVSMAGA